MANVELRDAIAVVQGMRNVFRSLEKLDSVLRVVESADNAVVEREAQLKALDAKVMDATAKVQEISADLARAEANASSRKNALEVEYQVRSEQLLNDFNTRKATLDKSLSDAEAALASFMAVSTSERANLTAERDALAGQVADLNKALESLKARVSGV